MWNVDLVQEQITRDCVNQNFFKKYIEPKYNAKIDSIDDLDTQFKGIDFVMHFNNQTINSDLKAQTNNYINNPTPTFCLELSYMLRGDLKNGWFVRDDLDTEQYIFMWIHQANVVKVKNMSYINNVNDIHNYELMFIKKESIQNYLNTIGLTKENIKQIDKHIRNNNISRLYYDIETQKTCEKRPQQKLTFVYSTFLEEKVINLVLPKQQLSKIAQAHYIIQDNQINILKEASKYTRKTIIV
jgi:hypothetical protein